MASRFLNEAVKPSSASDRETSSSEAASKRSLGTDGGMTFPPNSLALAILAEVKERQKDRRETDPNWSQELLREGRARGQYGYEPAE